MRLSILLLATIASTVLTALLGCAHHIPKEALTLQPEAASLRRLQTRRYDTSDESMLLQAALSVLQDLGFELDESEAKLGLLVASKNRDATDAVQITNKIIVGVFVGTNIPVDVTQRIRISLVTRAITPRESTVRITFQRMVWNDLGQISRIESLEDPALYQEFFSKLSKSLFLEAHNI